MANRIYVIQFDSGRIKVGLTRNFEKRLQQHSGAARAFDETVARHWSSDVHTQASDNELSLIEFCSKRGRQCAREWFMGVLFEDVVEHAKQLPMYLDEVAIRASRDKQNSLWRGLTLVETERGQESMYDSYLLESAMKIARECFEMVRENDVDDPMFEPLEDMNGLSLFQGFVAFHLWGKSSAEHKEFRDRVDAATLQPLDRMMNSLRSIFEEARESTIDLGKTRPDLLASPNTLSQERIDWVTNNFRAA